MYTVYVDDLLIHSQHSPSQEHHLVNPTLKLAENSAGSFEFTIPYGHPGYNEIQRMTSTIAVERENQCIWTGRVISESEDFMRNRKYTCEGALAFLNDTYQPHINYQNTTVQRLFRQIILRHNEKKKFEPDRQFTIGTVNVEALGEDFEFEYETDYEKTWDVLKNMFIDRLDGHLSITYNGNDRTPIINYKQEYEDVSVQSINFGENLMDFTKNWDLSNLFTVIIPKGQIRVEVGETGSTGTTS